MKLYETKLPYCKVFLKNIKGLDFESLKYVLPNKPR